MGDKERGEMPVDLDRTVTELKEFSNVAVDAELK